MPRLRHLRQWSVTPLQPEYGTAVSAREKQGMCEISEFMRKSRWGDAGFEIDCKLHEKDMTKPRLNGIS
jgi:hypothetical protein